MSIDGIGEPGATWCGICQRYHVQSSAACQRGQFVPAAPDAAAPAFGSMPLTGSTAFLVERDEWKRRALEAESKLDAATTALSSLASYVSAPYYPEPETAFDAAEAEKRVRWGIDHFNQATLSRLDKITSQFCGAPHTVADYFGRCPACVCDTLRRDRAMLNAEIMKLESRLDTCEEAYRILRGALAGIDKLNPAEPLLRTAVEHMGAAMLISSPSNEVEKINTPVVEPRPPNVAEGFKALADATPFPFCEVCATWHAPDKHLRDYTRESE